MSANRLWVAALAALLLGGCGGADSDANRAEALAVDLEAAEANNAAEAEAPMAWSYGGDPAAPRAIYGPARNDIRFGVRCDREAGEIVVQRAAGGGGDTLTLSTGGHAVRLDADPAGAGHVQARVPLGDPLLARLAAPGAMLSAGVAGEEPLILPGGSPIKRVVTACTAPEPERFEGPVFAGVIPCADCPGIDVRLTFAEPDAGSGRYRLVQAYRDRGTITTDGDATLVGRDFGPVYRLAPDGGGAPVWIEMPEPGVIVYRTPDNQPDRMLDNYPLRRVE